MQGQPQMQKIHVQNQQVLQSPQVDDMHIFFEYLWIL